MSHRRIVRTDQGYLVRETGTGRDIAHVPIDPVWEPDAPAQRTAREIRALPKLLDYLRHRAFHGDSEAAELLKEATPN